MGESFVASVQFDDLTGTAAADGHEAGGPLGELAKRLSLPPGFSPIGFGLSHLHPLANGKLPFCLYAVDTNKVDLTEEGIQALVKKREKLPTTGFHGEIAPKEFQQVFKRFSLRLHSKGLRLAPEQLTIEDHRYPDEGKS